MVDIILATYNGEANLVQQLDSIIKQQCQDWRLVIRDDVSSDNTPALLEQYANKFNGKIKIIQNDGLNLGACQNFSRLLRHAEADYIMLCDQDDVWLPDKIQITLAKMKEMEATYGIDKPLLVHTDLRVVDANLKVLADSGWQYQKIDPVKGCYLNRSLVQNVPTGCTMMINRALRDIALPIPKEAIMHDWWLALVAAAFGRIGYVAHPTLLYRQHGENVSGAQAWETTRIVRRLLNLGNTKKIIRDIQKQAGAFLKRYHDVLDPESREMIGIFAGLSDRGFLERRYYIMKYGFLHTGLARNIGMLLFC